MLEIESSEVELGSIAVAVQRERIVLIRNAPAHPAFQLRITAALGTAYGTQLNWRGRYTLPELRLESDEHPNPYNRIWHSDTSWSPTPTTYTLLYALTVSDGGATTELADMIRGYAALPEAYRLDIHSWQAHHHVKLSREKRFGAHQPIVSTPPQKQSRFARWQQERRQGLTIPARSLTAPQAPGTLHPVVQTDPCTQQRYIYLGEHAWKLTDRAEREGLSAIEQLTDACTQNVQQHEWRTGDLLIFNNRTFLHRRGDQSLSQRVLRRTMAFADHKQGMQ